MGMEVGMGGGGGGSMSCIGQGGMVGRRREVMVWRRIFSFSFLESCRGQELLKVLYELEVFGSLYRSLQG